MKFVKEAIEETFLALLDEKPYNKITVKDIVDRCGVNRNTFYYHFHDIPSLLEEIMTDRIDALIQQHCRPGSLVECMSVTTEYFLKNKKAVMHLYKYIPRDVFVENLDRLSLYLVEEYITNVTASMDIRQEDRDLIVRFFKCMMVGVFLDWFESGMRYDLLGNTIRLYELQEDSALRLLKHASE